MNAHKVYALLLSAAAWFWLVFGLAGTLMPLLPGFEESLGAVSDLLGQEQSPLVLGNPSLQAAISFIFLVVPASLAGLLGLWWWRRAERGLELADAELARRQEWGSGALEWWLGGLTQASSKGDGLQHLVQQARVSIAPHLGDGHFGWLSGLMAVVTQSTYDSNRYRPVEPDFKGTLLMRTAAVGCFGLAAVALFWGLLTVVMLLWFGRSPLIEQETSPSMLVGAMSFPCSIFAASAWLAGGLLSLDRQKRRRQLEDERRRLTLDESMAELVLRAADSLRRVPEGDHRALADRLAGFARELSGYENVVERVR